MNTDPKSFFEFKSISELAREQNMRPLQRLEDILATGAQLWGTDDEFESFVNAIHDRRHEPVHV